MCVDSTAQYSTADRRLWSHLLLSDAPDVLLSVLVGRSHTLSGCWRGTREM